MAYLTIAQLDALEPKERTAAWRQMAKEAAAAILAGDTDDIPFEGWAAAYQALDAKRWGHTLRFGDRRSPLARIPVPDQTLETAAEDLWVKLDDPEFPMTTALMTEERQVEKFRAYCIAVHMQIADDRAQGMPEEEIEPFSRDFYENRFRWIDFLAGYSEVDGFDPYGLQEWVAQVRPLGESLQISDEEVEARLRGDTAEPGEIDWSTPGM